jgi:hypothetical protein
MRYRNDVPVSNARTAMWRMPHVVFQCRGVQLNAPTTKNNVPHGIQRPHRLKAALHRSNRDCRAKYRRRSLFILALVEGENPHEQPA